MKASRALVKDGSNSFLRRIFLDMSQAQQKNKKNNKNKEEEEALAGALAEALAWPGRKAKMQK